MLALFVLIASPVAYYMDKYGAVIDVVMIENILQTNAQEAADLINPGLVWRVLIFGVIPAFFILKYKPKLLGIKTELISKLFVGAVLLVLMGAVLVPFTPAYASFIREHKIIRFYANPTYFSHSTILYIRNQFKSAKSNKLTTVANDLERIGPEEKTELIILVIGETARADHFSLNGYGRETNPELKKQKIISLKNVTSCGTSTAVSVPCMFSALNRSEFDINKALHYENALDVLQKNKVEILWRDNNSNSKSVAARVPYENFKSPAINSVCDEECRDIGMLRGLDNYINARKGKDILIVLHQMGNHGPAYYKRYPPDFERFTPACKSNDLAKCTNQQIINAYDNAILYTDYFLSNVIGLLKRHDRAFETVMLYVSDHGESLGEYGVYLHGAPYAVAPKAQIHVPAILWLGSNFDYPLEGIRAYENRPLSHNDLFCALLITYEMGSKTCEAWKPALYQNEDLLP